jgi:multidrug efflux pump subunit AcrB
MRVGVVMVIPFRSLLVPVVILCAQPLAVIAAGIWFAYCVGGSLCGVALAAVAMLSMAGIVVAAAILMPIGMPAVPTSPIWPILSISTNSMDGFVNMA